MPSKEFKNLADQSSRELASILSSGGAMSKKDILTEFTKKLYESEERFAAIGSKPKPEKKKKKKAKSDSDEEAEPKQLNWGQLWTSRLHGCKQF